LVNLRELVGGVGLGPWIGKLTKLETLIRVERVKYIPPEIGNCTNLRNLWIYGGTGITSIPPEMENLKLLGSLNLAGQQISGSIPAFFGNMTSLRDLNLSGNKFSGNIPKELEKLNLDISGNANMTGVYIPKCGLTLKAAGTKITVRSCLNYCDASSFDCCWTVRSWRLMGKETTVDASNRNGCCLMTGVSCSGTQSSVTRISWSNQNLTGSIPEDITNIKSLQKL